VAVPTYQMIMLPVLQEVAGAEQRAVSEIVGGIESRFQLSIEDREQMLPSGTQRTIVNRVHWAVSYMVQAGLIQRVGRGLVQVTERGREVLARPPKHIDVKFLGQYAEFPEFRSRAKSKTTATAIEESQATPEEILESTFDSIRQSVESDLLERVKAAPPIFFEQLVVDLLVAMGYGARTQATPREESAGAATTASMGSSMRTSSAWMPCTSRRSAGRPIIQFVGRTFKPSPAAWRVSGQARACSSRRRGSLRMRRSTSSGSLGGFG